MRTLSQNEFLFPKLPLVEHVNYKSCHCINEPLYQERNTISRVPLIPWRQGSVVLFQRNASNIIFLASQYVANYRPIHVNPWIHFLISHLNPLRISVTSLSMFNLHEVSCIENLELFIICSFSQQFISTKFIPISWHLWNTTMLTWWYEETQEQCC